MHQHSSDYFCLPYNLSSRRRNQTRHLQRQVYQRPLWVFSSPHLWEFWLERFWFWDSPPLLNRLMDFGHPLLQGLPRSILRLPSWKQQGHWFGLAVCVGAWLIGSPFWRRRWWRCCSPKCNSDSACPGVNQFFCWLWDTPSLDQWWE